MIELVYMSRATHIFDQSELEELLVVARHNNEELGVTGMLLYDGVGTFMQALEGNEEEVNALFSHIAQDQRHTNIQKLATAPIQKRCFPDWKMAFYQISQDDISSMEGYSTFLEDEHFLTSEDNETGAVMFEMLNRFKRNAAALRN